MATVQFTIEKRLNGAFGRAGWLETPHGAIGTPAFVAVATKASVKALTAAQVRALGSEVVLANTYHLHLEPGENVVAEAGGLAHFMGWNGPTMTDSGGFQVYSLGVAYAREYSKFLSKRDVARFLAEASTMENKKRLASVSEEGVTFKSYLDGSSRVLTPERSIEIQHALGADVMFAFDDFVSPTEPYSLHRISMERTHRWAERSLAAHRHSAEHALRQALFGIVQGGPHRNLREESACAIARLDFDGFGIGGSYTKEEMVDVLRWVTPFLPEEKPRHLLGIGEPLQLFLGVEHGIDMFDCVAPTREARNGRVYTRRGPINIFNARFTRDFSALDAGCHCETCVSGSTRAYLAHLFRARELLGYTLASIHNLFFVISLVKQMRAAILDGTFGALKGSFMREYGGTARADRTVS